MGLHIFFLPFHHSGHLIPMVDLAKLFAIRDGVKATIVTTPATALRIKPSLESFPHPVDLLSLPCPPENSTSLSSGQLNPELEDYLNSMESPFETLVADHAPDCIVSDLFYPWSAHVASRHAIPRLALHVCSCFSIAVSSAIFRWGPHNIAALGDEETFLVPGLPHPVRLSKSRLPAGGAISDEGMTRFCESLDRTYGTIANTFREMDRGYNERLFGNKTWLVGPVSLCKGAERVGGGGECDVDRSSLDSWLDGKKTGSVIYVCFGSLGVSTTSQLREIASGLVASNCPFLWVVRNSDDLSVITLESCCEERGLIIRGWAPQTVILNHPAVGGFLTHCGWNSVMEGANAGVPMVTWPLYAEQFLNEMLVVDVLRIGVPVGSKVRAESEGALVSGGKVKEVVEEVMGGGADAEERRKRAEMLAEMAKMAVEEGGSSYNDLSSLIQELEGIKATKSSKHLISPF